MYSKKELFSQNLQSYLNDSTEQEFQRVDACVINKTIYFPIKRNECVVMSIKLGKRN